MWVCVSVCVCVCVGGGACTHVCVCVMQARVTQAQFPRHERLAVGLSSGMYALNTPVSDQKSPTLDENSTIFHQKRCAMHPINSCIEVCNASYQQFRRSKETQIAFHPSIASNQTSFIFDQKSPTLHSIKRALYSTKHPSTSHTESYIAFDQKSLIFDQRSNIRLI